MIEDLRHRPEDALLEADLCIVGAGAAGIALARELAAEHHNDVVVLESGGLKRHAATDGLNDGDSQGLPPASLTESRGRLFGGATALWAGQCIPPEPETFRERPWIPHSGWPFAASELEPYIHRAEALFQIEGEVYDERTWDSFAVRRVATDADRLEHRFTVWCPKPHLGRLHRPRLKASAHVRVLLHATATEIVTTPSGESFDFVRAATPEGGRSLLCALEHAWSAVVPSRTAGSCWRRPALGRRHRERARPSRTFLPGASERSPRRYRRRQRASATGALRAVLSGPRPISARLTLSFGQRSESARLRGLSRVPLRPRVGDGGGETGLPGARAGRERTATARACADRAGCPACRPRLPASWCTDVPPISSPSTSPSRPTASRRQIRKAG